MRSCRSAARKVNVRHLPKGALARRRLPRAHRPRVGVMLVLVQVSSMNTKRAGSSLPWWRFQRSRRLLTSGRSCSLAKRLFFITDALSPDEARQHGGIGLDPMLSHQPARDRYQGQITLTLNELRKPLSQRFKYRAAIPAHRTGLGPVAAPPGLQPFHRRRHAHSEPASRLAAGQIVLLNSCNNPLTKIFRIRSDHL
jgi:hypothetical protein